MGFLSPSRTSSPKTTHTSLTKQEAFSHKKLASNIVVVKHFGKIKPYVWLKKLGLQPVKHFLLTERVGVEQGKL